MTPGEVRRLYFIIRTFLSYGLDELIPKIRITLPLRLWDHGLSTETTWCCCKAAGSIETAAMATGSWAIHRDDMVLL